MKSLYLRDVFEQSNIPMPLSDNECNNMGFFIDEIYRNQSRSVFATLVKFLGDVDVAEEALHDAFKAALEQWPRDGIPANPRAWLVSTGRFKGIDAIRRRSRFDALPDDIEERLPVDISDELDGEGIEDDRLRLIFTCCHPALAADAQVALTLREVCGLKTEEIASAFLIPAPTLAQRIVRAKTKIKEARIPYEVPSPSQLAERLGSVLHVIYLIFNEGYFATSGATLTRPELSQEAIHLGRLVLKLLPDAEVAGLLALMLLQESRRPARTLLSGDLVLLEDQDRTLWDKDIIAEGSALVEQALASRQFGTYSLQAAISAVHANAPSASATDWAEIVSLYNILLSINPSPVIELNRAVAIAMRDNPQAGLTLIDAILERGELTDYHLAHSAKADLHRRLGKTEEAKTAYETALKLAVLEPERRFLEGRLRELPD